MIIGISLFVLIVISAFIPYQSGIDIEINFTQALDGKLYYFADIPQSAMRSKTKFDKITFTPSYELPLPNHFQIGNISDVMKLSGKSICQMVELIPTERLSKDVLLDKSIIVHVKILLKKESVMMWIMGKITKLEVDN